MKHAERRPRMRRVLLRGCLTAALAAALVCTVTFLFFAFRIMEQQDRERFRAESYRIAQAVAIGGPEAAASETGRITWVSPDGAVLYDSAVPASELESHADRTEIRDALANGFGESSRYSSTLGSKTLNFAVRNPDGTVVRFSLERLTELGIARRALVPSLISVLLAAVLALLIASHTARRILASIERIDLQGPESGRTFEELQPLVQRIEAQNRQLQDQLEAQTTEHARQDRFRREFTANISHELKTPLTSISGFAEIIRDGLVRQEDIPRFAGNIYKEARRLITLVGDIIRISQMDDNQLPIQREPFDLVRLCSDALDHLEPAADAAGVRCYLDAPETLPKALGAAMIAEEMISNLCDNAIKYNRPGGVVWLRLRQTGRLLAVTVEDTGIGIPLEHQGHVFERFYRVDKNRSKEKGGTGLGLSIVKHGALYHGTAPVLESTPGAGTKITVFFPAV